jgi:hypothetical protein
MKKYLLPAMMLFFVFNSLGQQATPSQSFTREEYLKLSRKEARTGRTLLIVGSALLAINCIGASSTPFSDTSPSPFLTMVGIGMVSGGIGCLVSSGAKRHKSAKLSIGYEATPGVEKKNLAGRPTPAVAVTLNF